MHSKMTISKNMLLDQTFILFELLRRIVSLWILTKGGRIGRYIYPSSRNPRHPTAPTRPPSTWPVDRFRRLIVAKEGNPSGIGPSHFGSSQSADRFRHLQPAHFEYRRLGQSSPLVRQWRPKSPTTAAVKMWRRCHSEAATQSSRPHSLPL